MRKTSEFENLWLVALVHSSSRGYGLSPFEKIVLLGCVRRMDDENDDCYPSRYDIAKYTEIERWATISKSIKKLESKKILEVVRASGNSNHYQLTTDFKNKVKMKGSKNETN